MKGECYEIILMHAEKAFDTFNVTLRQKVDP